MMQFAEKTPICFIFLFLLSYASQWMNNNLSRN